MKWHVEGADRETGKDISLVLDAASEVEARADANRRGILVSQIASEDVLPYASPAPLVRLPAPRKLIVIGSVLALVGCAALGIAGFAVFGGRKPSQNGVVTVQAAARSAKYKVTITGGAWLTRNSGSSDLLRGLDVALVAGAVPSSVVAQDLQTNAAECKKLAADRRATAQQFRSEFGTDISSAAEYDREAAQFDARAASVMGKIAALPPTVDLTTAYDASDETKGYSANMGSALGAAHLGTTKTNIDGKYSIAAELPAGRYYIYAITVSKVFVAEWLVPVNISSDGAITIDLQNDNAVRIHNYK